MEHFLKCSCWINNVHDINHKHIKRGVYCRENLSKKIPETKNYIF